MGNRVERLRVGLLGGAGLLACVIGAFLWFAHHRLNGWLTAFPHKAGLNVKVETDGFTASRSKLGRTIYTIHAAKQIEYKDGKIALHDVDMVLYGTKGDRADRIYGKEFEYDQKTGVVRAIGEVHIDLQAPAVSPALPPTSSPAAPAHSSPALSGHTDAPGPQVIHVITSNLVYLENLGVAATSEPIEFHLAQMTGHAIGADYNSDSNVLILHAAVHVTGIAGGRPVNVTATRAVLDQRNQRTDLTEVNYDSLGETVQADTAIVYTRSDGSAERIAAQGHVTGQKDGATVTANNADVLLNVKSQPQSARLTGGISYQSDEPLRQARGKANDSTIAFDAQGEPSHAVFVGGVDLLERIRRSEDIREPWSTRELIAAKVEAALVSMTPRKSELRDADATGGAHLTLVSNGSLGKPLRASDGTTELAGDELKVHLVAAETAKGNAKGIALSGAKPGPQLDTLAGRGHTLLRQVTVGGIEQTTAGDMLDAKFRPAEAWSGSNAAGTPVQTADRLVQRAVQQGHVAMMRKAPAKGTADKPGRAGAKAAPQFDEEHATAERAVYDGDSDRLTLTGSVQMKDQGNVLWAAQIVLEHATGDAQAEGSVKAIYQQTAGQQNTGQQAAGREPARPQPAGQRGPGGQKGASAPGGNPVEPAHVLADHAELKHEQNTAIFYGGAGKLARLWQGGTQVEAAAIELSRDNLGDQRLFAHGLDSSKSPQWSADGDGPLASAAVHTTLVTMGSTGAGAGNAPGKPGGKLSSTAIAANSSPGGGTPARTPQAIRVASRELMYSDLLRQADFTGGVRVDNKDGTMRSRQATAYLQNPGVDNWGLEIPDEAPAGAVSDTPSAQNSTGRPVAGDHAPAGALTSFSGSVERVIAAGHIEIEQPGRRATGERLVYTASDGWSVLTGDPGALPRLVDAAKGTIMGVSLRFHSDDDDVLVSNALPGAEKAAPGQRVHSEMRVHPKGEKKPEGQKQ